MNKRIVCLAVALSALVLALPLRTFAATGAGRHFYIMHNGHKQPLLPPEEAVIEKYDGYYLDKKCTDDSDVKRIYLTFDDGYENGNVAKILDTLKEEGVPAAFFVLAHPVCINTDLIVRMAKEGHLVCNHSKDHKNMAALTGEQMEENLLAMERVYEEKTGRKIAKYFRFPEGCFDEEALATAQKLGYKTVFWSFAYPDWDNTKQPDPQASIQKILDNTHNGEVILLHPTSSTNAKILPTLIKRWKEMGYTFGTLDELTA